MNTQTVTQSNSGEIVYRFSIILLFLTAVGAVTLKCLIPPDIIGVWPQSLILFSYANNAVLAVFVLIAGLRLLFKEEAAGEMFILTVAIGVAFINLTNEIRHPHPETITWASITSIMLLVGIIVKRVLNEMK